MATLDYDIAFQKNLSKLQPLVNSFNGLGRIRLGFNLLPEVYRALKITKSLENLLTEQLSMCIDVRNALEQMPALETIGVIEADFNQTIQKVERILKYYISIHHLAIDFSDANFLLAGKRIKRIENIITKSIECNYDILRLLKRYNKRMPTETSQLAKDLSAHSANTLNQIP